MTLRLALQEHARANEVQLDGQAQRLCQQCSSFHPVAAFDGTKR
jgi:SBP domain